MSSADSHLPKPADRWAIGAILFAALCIVAAFATTVLVRRSIADLGATTFWHEVPFWVAIGATVALLWPAFKSFKMSRGAEVARASGDAVALRINASAARDYASITFGWGVFALLALAFFAFIFMNDTAVGKTFFNMGIIMGKWWAIAARFFTVNVVMFVTAEILVLVWGMIVALARLMPGRAGRPIRALAILYCDVFRGLPAIVTLYLIGFGIPTSGIPEVVVPWFHSWFYDVRALSPQQLKDLSRFPAIWWCILALTLTYGAYVAEVYRSGIESIHWSQVSAARSLGLSHLKTMRYVVVPQAVRRVVAPLLNDFIGLQKDTALVQILGVVDAFNFARGVAANAFNLSSVTVVAALFVLVTIPQARLVDFLMERDAQRTKAGGH
jgi:polar amino acid transport system permease protein